jgi:uncharacterized protein YecE (DUF72 family)
MRRHLELEIETLQNAPRDPDKLRRLLEVKQRQKEEAATITTAKEGLKKLETFIHMLDPDYRYAIEVRHQSWFDTNVYKLLSDKDICLARSQLDTIQTI